MPDIHYVSTPNFVPILSLWAPGVTLETEILTVHDFLISPYSIASRCQHWADVRSQTFQPYIVFSMF